MKKRIAFALVLVMLATMLSSCAGSGTPTTTTASSSGTSGSATTSAPAEPMEISWLPYNQIDILPALDSEVKRLIEEKFNVKITVMQTNVHNAEQWNLFWATGNAPDFSHMNSSNSAVFKLAAQGLVRDIPDGWLEQYMPDLMKNVFNNMEKDMVMGQITDKGKTYIVPYAGVTYPYVMAIRKDWMDNLGITNLPATPDELFEILKRFTFDDPDKNGKDDTYGIHGGSQKSYMRFGYIHNYYGVWPDAYYNIDGKITYTSTTDAYKESLKYLNTWFKAGVIDPEFATEDRVVQRKKWAEGRFGVLVDNPWWFSLSTPGNLTDMVKAADPNAEVVFFAPFKDANGRQLAQAFYPSAGGDGAGFFGINCTDEKMKKIMEIKNSFAADWDWYVRCTYGEEGKDYNLADGKILPVEASTKPEYLTEKGLMGFAIVSHPYETLKNHIYSAADVEAYDFAVQFGKLYVDMDFNFAGVNESRNLYAADIKTISDEFYYNAIMGKVDIDKSWDKFLNDLNSAGLQKVLDEYQAGVVK